MSAPRVEWLGESTQTIRDAFDSMGDGIDRTAVGEAAAWLKDFLTSHGGTGESAMLKEKGRLAGHSEAALQRAKRRLRITSKSVGYPRMTYWSLPPEPGDPPSGTVAQVPVTRRSGTGA